MTVSSGASSPGRRRGAAGGTGATGRLHAVVLDANGSAWEPRRRTATPRGPDAAEELAHVRAGNVRRGPASRVPAALALKPDGRKLWR